MQQGFKAYVNVNAPGDQLGDGAIRPSIPCEDR